MEIVKLLLEVKYSLIKIQRPDYDSQRCSADSSEIVQSNVSNLLSVINIMSWLQIQCHQCQHHGQELKSYACGHCYRLSMTASRSENVQHSIRCMS